MKTISRFIGFAVVLFVLWLARSWLFTGGMREQDLLGLTPAQVRSKYGEPIAKWDFRTVDPTSTEIHWKYAHGFSGAASLVKFKDGIVVAVDTRAGK